VTPAAAPAAPATPSSDTLAGVIARAATPAERIGLACFAPACERGLPNPLFMTEERCHPEGAPRLTVITTKPCPRPKDLRRVAPGPALGSRSSPGVRLARSFGRRQTLVRKKIAEQRLPQEANALDGFAAPSGGGAGVVEDAPLPGWAVGMRELLGFAAAGGTVPPFTRAEVVDAEVLAAAGGDGAGEWRRHALFAPLLAGADARLDTALRRSGVLDAEPSVRRALLTQLARRWNLASALTLQQSAPDAGLPPADAWAGLFDAYPVLGRILAVVWRNWQVRAAELLERLARDRAELDRRFGPLGALVELRCDAGDVHDDGAAVAVLRFAAGPQVVYKPRDLRVAAGWMELAALLNDRGLHPPLHLRPLLVRDGYLWDAFVEARPCTSAEEVGRYYRRMGMYARLLQLLDATDFIGENWVAHGEHPVPIDLETLLSPRPPLPADASAAEREGARRAEALPLRSGIVTARMASVPGRRGADLGALAAADAQDAGFDVAGAGGAETARFAAGNAIPSFDGRLCPASEHFGEIEAGYLAMTAALRDAAPVLAVPGGVLDRLGAAPVRFVWRNTHVYSRVLDDSLLPERLRDGAARELSLQRLSRAATGPATSAAAASEADALRDLDLPLFAALPGDDGLRLRGGVVIPGFFDGTSLDRVRARLRDLPARGDDEEADALRTALFLLHPAPIAPVARSAPAGAWEGPWRETASAIGDEIAAAAFHVQGEPAWMGLSYEPERDLWRCGPLGHDLLTGTAGLAVVFAELHRATGLDRFATLARAALRPARARLAAGAESGGGGMQGGSALLYAAARTGAALDDAALLAEAAAAVERAAVDAADSAEGGGGGGIVGGLPGRILALTAAARWLPGSAAARLAADAGERLRASCGADGRFPHPAYPTGAAWLDALPGPRAAARLALLRLDGDAPPLDLSGSVTPGDLLAALAGGRICPASADAALAMAHRRIAAAPTLGAARGLLDCAELALAAYAATGRAHDRARVEALASRIVAGRRAYGAWFPDTLAAGRHHPSAVFGLGALALLLLRVGGAEGGSLRLLE